MYTHCLQETYFRSTDLYRLKRFPGRWKLKKAILISDKIDFKIKTITKERHYTMIKRSIQEEDITIVKIYESNIGAPQYIRQMLTGIKREIK